MCMYIPHYVMFCDDLTKLGTMKAFLFIFITLCALTVWQTTQTGHGNLISRTQVLNVKKNIILYWKW